MAHKKTAQINCDFDLNQSERAKKFLAQHDGQGVWLMQNFWWVARVRRMHFDCRWKLHTRKLNKYLKDFWIFQNESWGVDENIRARTDLDQTKSKNCYINELIDSNFYNFCKNVVKFFPTLFQTPILLPKFLGLLSDFVRSLMKKISMTLSF